MASRILSKITTDSFIEYPSTVEQVRDGLREDSLETSVIQLSGDIEGEAGNDVIIRTRNLSADEAEVVVGHLHNSVGEMEVKRIETVGAVIGSEVTENTLLNVMNNCHDRRKCYAVLKADGHVNNHRRKRKQDI